MSVILSKKDRLVWVDMDGILVDLMSTWLTRYNQIYSDTVTVADMKTWEVHNHVAMGTAIYDIWDEDGFWPNLQPIEGAVNAFKRLQEAPHLTVKVASSPATAESARAKINWCREHLGLHKRDVTLLHNKHLLTGQVLIDDSPKNAVNWGTTEGLGERLAMTIAYPANESVSGYYIVRAESYKDTVTAWEEIVEALV